MCFALAGRGGQGARGHAGYGELGFTFLLSSHGGVGCVAIQYSMLHVGWQLWASFASYSLGSGPSLCFLTWEGLCVQPWYFSVTQGGGFYCMIVCARVLWGSVRGPGLNIEVPGYSTVRKLGCMLQGALLTRV